MKKGTGEFVKVEKEIYVCDQCRKELNVNSYIIFNHEWNDGYDNFGNQVDMCSMDCLRKYIASHDSDYVFRGNEDIHIDLPSEIAKELFESLNKHDTLNSWAEKAVAWFEKHKSMSVNSFAYAELENIIKQV